MATKYDPPEEKHPTPPQPHAAPEVPLARRADPLPDPDYKLAPVGSKDYVAGQPMDEEEKQKTEHDAEAARKANEERVKADEARNKKVADERAKAAQTPRK